MCATLAVQTTLETSMHAPMAGRDRRGSNFTARYFDWSVDADSRVGTATLNRPERKNPLTFQSYDELTLLFEHLSRCSDVRSVIVRGEGDNFCSGGDVHEIIGPLLQMKNAGPAQVHADDRRPDSRDATLPTTDHLPPSTAFARAPGQ